MMNLIGQEIGNYKLLDLLGQGGSADVYLGEHKYHRSYVAVKILRKRASPFPTTNRWKKRGSNELHILSHVAHPYIIRMDEYGTQDNVQFLIMDWATQGTLLDLFAKSLPISTVATYVKQIASALQYLHMMHVIHRDIKPTNILVKQDISVLLADFGSAIDYRTINYSNYQSAAVTTYAATAAYTAPEQTQGRPCPASDQYALGVLVYQWLCKELPFHLLPTEMVDQYSNTCPPPLRDKVPTLPSAVEQVVLTALAKDPDSRFPNIQTFAEVFGEVCQSLAYRTPAMLCHSSMVAGPRSPYDSDAYSNYASMHTLPQ
jgi:serine/threonine protein kinase